MQQRQGRQTVAGWNLWRTRKERRIQTLETVSYVIAVQAILLSLLAQMWRGFLSSYSWSGDGMRVVLVLAGVINIAIVLAPERGIGAVKTILHGLGSPVLQKGTAAVLMLIYVVLLPVGMTIGRRRFLARHATAGPWVGRRGSQWRVATWSTKNSVADESIVRRGTLARMFGYCLDQGNILLLLALVVLLVAVSLSVLAHTPYLAPFVYTIF